MTHKSNIGFLKSLHKSMKDNPAQGRIENIINDYEQVVNSRIENLILVPGNEYSIFFGHGFHIEAELIRIGMYNLLVRRKGSKSDTLVYKSSIVMIDGIQRT